MDLNGSKISLEFEQGQAVTQRQFFIGRMSPDLVLTHNCYPYLIWAKWKVFLNFDFLHAVLAFCPYTPALSAFAAYSVVTQMQTMLCLLAVHKDCIKLLIIPTFSGLYLSYNLLLHVKLAILLLKLGQVYELQLTPALHGRVNKGLTFKHLDWMASSLLAICYNFFTLAFHCSKLSNIIYGALCLFSQLHYYLVIPVRYLVPDFA